MVAQCQSASTHVCLLGALLDTDVCPLRTRVTVYPTCTVWWHHDRVALCCRCLEDLEWSSQHTLTQLLHTLLLTAPFTATAHRPSTGVSSAGTCSGDSAADAAAVGQCLGELQALLQQFQPLVRSSSKRFSAGEVALLAKVFFHPALFQQRYVA